MALRTPLGAILERQAVSRGDSPFLTIVDSGQRATYREFNALVNRSAHGLTLLGVRREAFVGLMLSNSLEHMICSYALKKLGAVEVAINHGYRGPGLARMINLTESPLLVTEAGFLDPIGQVVEDLTHLSTLVVVGLDSPTNILGRETRPFDGVMVERDDNPGQAVSDTDSAYVLFSSGSTGLPKGCMLSHRFAVRNAESVINAFDLTESDVCYTPWPLCHMGAAVCEVVSALITGGQVALRSKLSVSRYWDEVRSVGATWCMMMGGSQRWLWDREASPADRNHKVRFTWGGPFPVDRDAFEARFCLKTAYCYGLSDAGNFSIESITVREPPNSSGKVRTECYDVRIHDENDDELPPGEVGEIVCRPVEPHVILEGYFGQPEATLEAFRNLWFHTGDLGYFEDGYLFFVERKKQVIRHGGENILPGEVEEVVHDHPAVAECAVMGVPNDLREEDVAVFVVLAAGAQLSTKELQSYCKSRMARWMVPTTVRILDEMPKTTTGKPTLGKLRAMLV